MQVRLRGSLVDSEDSVDNIGGKLVGQGSVELSGERGSGDTEEEFTIDFLGKLEIIEELIL